MANSYEEQTVYLRAPEPEEAKKILSLQYMKTNGPWPMFELPIAYYPDPGHDYHPPVFMLGTLLDDDQTMALAKHLNVVKSKSKSIDTGWSIRLARVLAVKAQMRKFFGRRAPRLVMSEQVFTPGGGEEETIILGVATNYNVAGKEISIPLNPFEILEKVLAEIGIKAEWKWYMKFDFLYEGNVDMNWYDEYCFAKKERLKEEREARHA